MERIPFENPGGTPIISAIGEVFTEDEIILMERAAEELNLTEETPRYSVIIDRDDSFAANGTRLPANTFRVRVQGGWTEDKDLGPLLDRVEELRVETSS